MSFDNYRTTPRDRVHYSFGFAVADSVNGDGSVYIRSLPAFTAAAIEIDGGLGEMARSWDHLYDQWFPDRPWTPVDLPALKLFHRRPDEVGWHNFQLDCAVPFRAG
jgi:DNA gyrase inhibitor GyrI